MIEEELEKYPYLKNLTSHTLFITQEQYSEYKNDELITVQNEYNDSEESISKVLISRILSDERYFNHLINIIKNKTTDKFKVSFIIYGDNSGNISMSISSIVRLLSNLNNLNNDKVNKIQELKDLTSTKEIKKEFFNKEYTFNIENKKVELKGDEILEILFLTDEEYRSFISKPNFYKNIPNEEYVYILKKFIEENKIFENYIISNNIQKRYKELTSLQHTDYQSINTFNSTQDDTIDKVGINNKLKDLILENLPQDASDIEKAIYIYIKMCKILTYDPEFYAMDQSGKTALKHEDINRVSTITPESNTVVCYEFNAIYGKMLEMLGINFITNSKTVGGFGGGHAFLNFRKDKFLCKADSVTSILGGDLVRSKLNQPLEGLICLNTNLNTQDEFKKMINSMQSLISKQETKKIDPQEKDLDFNRTLELYRQTRAENSIKIELTEKLDILLDKIVESRLIGMDAIGYLIHVRRILFNDIERKNNISISIVRENIASNQNIYARPTLIIALNNNNLEDETKNNVYLCYNPNSNIKQISKDELQQAFNENKFEYLNGEDHFVPGINVGSEKKNAR